MKLVFNPEQLEVGEAIISSIDENIDDVSSNIKDDFNRISNTAMDKKINLSETIKWDDLDTDVSTFKNYLVDVTNVAKKAAVVCETYSNGNQTADDMNILLTSLNACKNVAEPDEFSKLLYTGLMGGAMFTEGFMSFFEDLGDCALVAGSLFTGLFNKDLSNNIKSFASKDHSKSFIEDNEIFEKINKNSYFDKDSVYASIFKITGKATAGIVCGHVVSNWIGSGTAAQASKARQISTTAGTFGSDTSDNLRRGMNLRDAVIFAGAGVASTHFIDKYVAPGLSTKVAENLSNSTVGTVIGTVGDAASTVFGEHSDVAKEGAKKVAEYGIKEAQTKTDNLVSNDGNESTIEDYAAQKAANKTMDVVKTIGEETIIKSL